MSNNDEKEPIKFNLFESDDSELSLRPLTKGLGFKDRVKAKTLEINTGSPKSADAGTLDIGRGELDHGQVHQTGEQLQLRSAENLSPILLHSGHDGLIKKTFKKTSEAFFGALIDSLFVGALAIVFFAGMMDYLEIREIEAVYQNLQASLVTFGLLFVFSFLGYKVFTRTFYGKSLGEWSCRHQMGSLESQSKFYYSVQVLIRETFNLMTGVIVFPILSALLKKDVGYYFSGLHTYIEHK